jgi:hypothetical protein
MQLLTSFLCVLDHLQAGHTVGAPVQGRVHRVGRGPVLSQQHVVANTVHLKVERKKIQNIAKKETKPA